MRDDKELAAIIARKIFEIGGMHSNDPVIRIEFKVGTYPSHERPAGGFSERPLADFIERVLKNIAVTDFTSSSRDSETVKE